MSNAALGASPAARNMNIQFAISFSSIALLYYDYALTWTREVKYIWKGKLTISSVLYLFCRYALVANVIYPIAWAKEISSLSCDDGYKICACLGVLGRIGILSVWGIRTAAVFHGNKWIVLFFSTLGLSVLILNVAHVPYVVCTGSSGESPYAHFPFRRFQKWVISSGDQTRDLSLGHSQVTHQMLAIVSATYEVLTAVFTTIRCFQLLRCKGHLSIPRDGIIFLVLQQGLLYFVFVSFFAFGVVILQYIEPLKGTWLVRLLNAYNTPICGLMTARYLLHLREWEHDHGCTFTSCKDDVASSIVFQQPSLGSFEGWTEEFMKDSLFNSGVLESHSCELSAEKPSVHLDDVSSLQYDFP